MLQVIPAKPDYMIERRVLEEKRRMEEKLAREEEQKDKQLKRQIKETEEKLQRRRVRIPLYAFSSVVMNIVSHFSSFSRTKKLI
jgi:hypothetical protein